MWDYVTPQDYGAFGDGVSDDALAFQNAVNNSAQYPVYVPRTPNGYALGSTVILKGSPYPGTPPPYSPSNPAPPTWQILQGSGALLKAASGFAGSALIQIGSSGTGHNGWNVKISGLTFDMTNATFFPSAAIYFDTADQSYPTIMEMSFIRLTDLVFQNCFMAITDVLIPGNVTASTCPVNDLQVINVLCRQLTGRPQIALARSAGFILFRDVHVDFEFNSSWPTMGPLAFVGSNPVALAQFGAVSIAKSTGGVATSLYPAIGGLEFERFDINSGNGIDNSTAGLSIIGTPGGLLAGNSAVYLTRVSTDGTAGIGIFIEYVTAVFGKDLCNRSRPA